MATKQTGSNELVTVLWSDTKEEVTLPRRLIVNGNKRAQTNHLISTGQIPDPNAPAPVVIEEPEVIERAVLDNGALDAISARLTAIEQLDRPSLPTDDALAAWARSAERVGLSHVEMNAVAETVTKQCEQVGSDAQQRLGELDSQQAALVQSVAESITQGQEDTALAIQSLQASGAAAIGEIEQEAQATAKKEARSEANKVALEESKKHWGAGTTVATQDPSKTDLESFGTRWFGRPLVSGDSCLQPVKTGLIVWRFTGGRWLRSAELVPKTELVSQQLSVHDESSPVTLIVGAGGSPAGGGGGGAQRLSVATMGGGVRTEIADSSCWAATGTEVLAGELLLRVSNGTGSAFLATTFSTMDGVNWENTDWSLLGNLAANPLFSIEIRPRLTAPKYPAGITPPTAGAVQACIVEATIVGGVGNYFVEGSVVWLQRSKGTTSPLSGPAPAWFVV